MAQIVRNSGTGDSGTFQKMHADLIEKVRSRLAFEIKKKGTHDPSTINYDYFVSLNGISFDYTHACVKGEEVFFINYCERFSLEELGDDLYWLADKVCAM